MEIYDYDVVCVGGGGAGVTAAIMAARMGARVALISKEPVGHGNTRIAGGGTTDPSLSPDDSPERFLANLVRAGEGLNNQRVAEALVKEAPQAAIIIESFGHAFSRSPEGKAVPSSTKPTGGHNVPRTLRSDPNAMGQSCRAAAARYKVHILENTLVTRLLIKDGRIQGLIALRLMDSQILAMSAKAVILATGGLGWLYYPHTDCVRSLTGDGYALALEAGAELVDMEQIQFKPFGFTHPKGKIGISFIAGYTIGAESRLVNALGEVVIPRGMDKMTRAQLNEVLAHQMAEGKTTEYGGLLLDLLPNLQTTEGRAFRERVKRSEAYINIRINYGEKAYRWEEPLDVCTIAHFVMGGVRIDEWGKSTIDGLYAIGEVAGGIHGANRLATVALAEVFLFGKRAGEDAVRRSKNLSQPKIDMRECEQEAQRIDSLIGSRGTNRPIRLVRNLQQVMWDRVGIVRSESTCREALSEIANIAEASKSLSISPKRRYNTELLDTIELGFLLTNAEAITMSAMERRESRGAHFRLDFPERSTEEGKRNIVVSKDGEGLRIKSRPVAGEVREG